MSFNEGRRPDYFSERDKSEKPVLESGIMPVLKPYLMCCARLHALGC